MRLYSNLIGNIGCDKSNTPTRDSFNSIEEQRTGQISTEQGRNATNDDQETLHIDEDTPVILCLDDIQEATATDSISADKIVIIQPEDQMQPDIVNLLECQEENTTFENTTVQLMEFQSGIDNLENQENNENIQNTGKYLIVCIYNTYIELQWLICRAISIMALIFFTGTRQDIPNVPSPFKNTLFWPGNSTQNKKKRLRDKIPAVATSDEWQQYHMTKEEEKVQKQKIKEDNKKKREEKRLQKIKEIEEKKEQRKLKKMKEIEEKNILREQKSRKKM